MSRGLTSANQAQASASYVEEIVLAHLAFDEPVYVNSGIGSITFAGNEYIGVGSFGNISDARESEKLGPLSLTLGLSGLDPNMFAEALSAGNFGDQVTIYIGYKQDDGTLADDPWIIWRGWYEFAVVSQGDENTISVTLQHDLSVLEEKDGARYTDEDQKQTYAADDGFEYVHEALNQQLVWGGRTITYGQSNDDFDF